MTMVQEPVDGGVWVRVVGPWRGLLTTGSSVLLLYLLASPLQWHGHLPVLPELSHAVAGLTRLCKQCTVRGPYHAYPHATCHAPMQIERAKRARREAGLPSEDEEDEAAHELQRDENEVGIQVYGAAWVWSCVWVVRTRRQAAHELQRGENEVGAAVV